MGSSKSLPWKRQRESRHFHLQGRIVDMDCSGKSQQITIQSQGQGRLSKEDIKRMIREAEEFASEDEEHRQRIEALNSLETYVSGVKNQLGDQEGLGGKVCSSCISMLVVTHSPLVRGIIRLPLKIRKRFCLQLRASQTGSTPMASPLRVKSSRTSYQVGNFRSRPC